MGKQTHEFGYAPRLLGAPEAAHYLGISCTTLRGLPISRTILGGRRLYDRFDLDAYASGLPREGESEATGENSCDAIMRGLRSG